MEKILGLDLGSRTCGIAISDTLGMLAHGVETYHSYTKENNKYSDTYTLEDNGDSTHYIYAGDNLNYDLNYIYLNLMI